jgi:hypothetical protein
LQRFGYQIFAIKIMRGRANLFRSGYWAIHLGFSPNELPNTDPFERGIADSVILVAAYSLLPYNFIPCCR